MKKAFQISNNCIIEITFLMDENDIDILIKHNNNEFRMRCIFDDSSALQLYNICENKMGKWVKSINNGRQYINIEKDYLTLYLRCNDSDLEIKLPL